VIIPTYNRPGMLREALASLVTQTFRNFETIVINDGGVDVGASVNSLNPEAPIRYFQSEARGGQSTARNLGLQKAKGKYIAFLDDDDLYLPKHLETLVSVLETTHFEVAYTDAYKTSQNSSDGKYHNINIEIPFSEDFNRDRLLVCNYIPMLTLMHKKSLLRKVGVFDEELDILEDWDLIIRLSMEVSFCHIPKATCKFTVRLGDAGHVNSSLARQLRGFKFVYEKHPVDNPEILRGRIEMLKRLKKEAVKADVC